MRKLLSAFLVLLLPTLLYAGQTVTTVSVTSSTAGTQVVSSISGGVCMTVPTGAAVPVYVARIEGACASVLTIQAGVRIPVPTTTAIWSTQCFVPRQHGYYGGVCAILESGSTAVTLNVNTW